MGRVLHLGGWWEELRGGKSYALGERLVIHLGVRWEELRIERTWEESHLRLVTPESNYIWKELHSRTSYVLKEKSYV